ncbi:DUF6406 domain-containing protein [Actinomadura sp. NPDC000929]|uniref:DUF6406 domain-containing protein n=1 Tax=Actinomadura sp. NPDC000929 TaxID=3154517 RepID=UPI00339B7EDC
MAVEKISLKQGTQTYVDEELEIGLMSAYKGEGDRPPEVLVSVTDDGERELTLHPGDAFLIGDQTWRLERVEEAGGERLGAVFARIE